MIFNPPLAGSYAPQDCLFLLKSIQPPDMQVEEKERLIQSGQKHYSEMVTHEHPHNPEYEKLFLELTARYRTRLAQDVINLAQHIQQNRPEPITLVSLARAGTPIGALLQRALTHLGAASQHFSISIIRDRGVDERALAYILRKERRPAAGIVFIDGWTAKGVITQELKQTIERWNGHQPEKLSSELYVIADIGGAADACATLEDYAIPSGILGATVSGLVSRSILNEQIEPNDFHGCVVYEHLRPFDRSVWFLDTISAEFDRLAPQSLTLPTERDTQRNQVLAYLAELRQRHGIININHIKPGVLEASRVMLRRVPGLLLLRTAECSDTAHLHLLAAEKNVPIQYDPAMPFNATALIKQLK